MRPILGTFVDITVEPGQGATDSAVADAYAEMERIHALMTAFSADGMLACIARAAPGMLTPVTPEVATLLRRALALAAATDGVFDPVAAGTRLVLAGKRPALAATPPHPAASWLDLTVHDDDAVVCARPLALDLGGIAKGYAVDRAAAILDAGDIAATVNAGGDLRFTGHAPRTVVIRGPLSADGVAETSELSGLPLPALASSLAQHDTDAGHTLTLVDPRGDAGIVESADFGVTVLAPDCATADALTKAALLLPRERLRAVVRAHGAIALRYDRALRFEEIA